MMHARPRGRGVVVASFAVAMLLTLIPLPDWALVLRPEWVALVLIYWNLALPERVGIGYAWVVGLLLDVLNGALLGQHALGLTVMAFFAVKLHQRVRVFPLWQQAAIVLVLVSMYLLLVLWVRGIAGTSPQTWSYFLSGLVSMALWPWLFMLMRGLRRRFRVA